MTVAADPVVIVGAGPAGRALAHHLDIRNVPVALVDPAPEHLWRATYSCWSDELPTWLPPGVIAMSTPSARIRGGATVDVARGYSVLDNAALQRALTVDRARLIDTRATVVDSDHVELPSGERVMASVVIDARGPVGRGPRQTAFGVVVPTAQAQPFLDGAGAVLMDWSPVPGRPGDGPPSFLYAVPLDEDRVLLEETCLAGDPALTRTELAARLAARMSGFDLDTAERTEIVSFALLGASHTPWRRTPFAFGAAGGLMHPATGYGIAAALAAADVVADAIAAGRDPVDALWPPSARIIHRLRVAGLRALLDLPPTELAAFFDTFAGLPVAHQRAFLSERNDLSQVAAAMAAVFGRSPLRHRIVLARAMGRR